MNPASHRMGNLVMRMNVRTGTAVTKLVSIGLTTSCSCSIYPLPVSQGVSAGYQRRGCGAIMVLGTVSSRECLLISERLQNLKLLSGVVSCFTPGGLRCECFFWEILQQLGVVTDLGGISPEPSGRPHVAQHILTAHAYTNSPSSVSKSPRFIRS